MSDLERQLHARFLDEPDSDVIGQLRRHARLLAPLLPDGAIEAAVGRVAAKVEGLGALEPLLAEPDITDVMVTAGRVVWVERGGRLERTSVVLDPAETSRLIERIVAPLGLRVDRSSPVVDARLADGARVHAIVPPLAVDGPCLTIRRFATKPFSLDAFASGEVVELLQQLVNERANVVVSGATGAGKTTLLNTLAGVIDRGERIITIEDAAELRLSAPHVVRLEARPANADGTGAVTIRDLVRAALRMRPDRIVVGEVRGAEALDMVQALNTGHDGSLSTCHANSPADALRRIETMALFGALGLPLAAVREQVRAAVDVVIQVGRRPGGERRIIDVSEVVAGPRRVHRLADGDRILDGPERGRLADLATPRNRAS